MMNLKKYIYSVSWWALLLLIIAATAGLVFSINQFGLKASYIMLLLAVWLLVVGCGLFLFLQASTEIIRRITEEEAADPAKKPSPKEEKIQSRNDTADSLDIDPVARKIVRRLCTEEDPPTWGQNLLGMLSAELEIMSGVFYYRNDENIFNAVASYAIAIAHQPYSFVAGEGLTGQAAMNRQVALYTTIPDEYAAVFSGLGKGKPSYLAIIPLVVKEQCVAVIEIAGFRFTVREIDQFCQIIARELSLKIEPAEKKETT